MLKIKRGRTESDYSNSIYSLDNISINDKSPNKEGITRLRTVDDDFNHTNEKVIQKSSLNIIPKNNQGSYLDGSEKSNTKRRRKKRVCKSHLDGFKESWKNSLIQQRQAIEQLENMVEIQGEVNESGQIISGKTITEPATRTSYSSQRSGRLPSLTPQTNNNKETLQKLSTQHRGEDYFRQGNENTLVSKRSIHNQSQEYQEILPVIISQDIKRIQKQSRYQNQLQIIQAHTPQNLPADGNSISQRTNSKYVELFYSNNSNKNIQQKEQYQKQQQQQYQQLNLGQEKCKLLVIDESIKVKECLGDSGVSSLTSSTVQLTNRNVNNNYHQDQSNSILNDNHESNLQGYQRQYLQDEISKDYQFYLKESAIKQRRKSNLSRKSKESKGQIFDIAPSPNIGVRASYRLFRQKQQQSHSPQQVEVAPGLDWVKQLRKGPTRASSSLSTQLSHEKQKFMQKQLSQDNQVIERQQLSMQDHQEIAQDFTLNYVVQQPNQVIYSSIKKQQHYTQNSKQGQYQSTSESLVQCPQQQQNEQLIQYQIQQQQNQDSLLNQIKSSRYPQAIQNDQTISKIQNTSPPESLSCLSSVYDKTISSTIITNTNKNTILHNKTGLESQIKMTSKILTSSIDRSNSPSCKESIVDQQIHKLPQPVQFKFLLPQKYQQKDIEDIQNRLLTLEQLPQFPSWWEDDMFTSDDKKIGQFDVDGIVISWDRKKTAIEESIEFKIKDLIEMEDCRVNMKMNQPNIMKNWKFEKILLEIQESKNNQNDQLNQSSHRELFGVNKDTGLKSSFTIWKCNEKQYFFQAIKSICLSVASNKSNSSTAVQRISQGVCLIDRNTCVLAFENQQVCFPVKNDNYVHNYFNDSILNNDSQFWTYLRVLQLTMDGLGVLSKLFAAGISVQQLNFQFNMHNQMFQLHHMTQAIKITEFDQNSNCKENDLNKDTQMITEKLQNDLQEFGNLLSSLCKEYTIETNTFESSQYQNLLSEIVNELLNLKLVTSEKIPLKEVPSFIKDRFFDPLIVLKIQAQTQQFKVYPAEFQKQKSKSISRSLATCSELRNSQNNKQLLSKNNGNNNYIARNNKFGRIPREQIRSTSSNSTTISAQQQQQQQQSNRSRATSQIRIGSRLSNYSKDTLDDQDLTTIKETINTLHEESGSVHYHSITPQQSKDSQSSKYLQVERKMSLNIKKSSSQNPVIVVPAAPVGGNTQKQLDQNFHELKLISDSYRYCQQIDNYLQSQGKVLAVYKESLNVGCVDFLEAVASLSQFCLDHHKLEILISLVDLCLDLHFQESLRLISITHQESILRLFLLAAFKALALNNIKKAIQLLQTTLELQNLAQHEIFQIHLNLGILFRQIDNTNAALSHFVASQEAAVNVYPSSLELASPFLQAGTLTENERYLEIALKIKRSNGEKPLRVLALTFKLGCMQLKKALFKEAEDSFRSYLELINSDCLNNRCVGQSMNTIQSNPKESQIFQARLNLRLSQLGQDPHHPCLVDLINNIYNEMAQSHKNLSPKTAVLAMCEIAEVLLSIKVQKNQILPLYAQCSVLASRDADRSLLTLVAQKLAVCQSTI